MSRLIGFGTYTENQNGEMIEDGMIVDDESSFSSIRRETSLLSVAVAHSFSLGSKVRTREGVGLTRFSGTVMHAYAAFGGVFVMYNDGVLDYTSLSTDLEAVPE